jgi:hypothetical protein
VSLLVGTQYRGRGESHSSSLCEQTYHDIVISERLIIYLLSCLGFCVPIFQTTYEIKLGFFQITIQASFKLTRTLPSLEQSHQPADRRVLSCLDALPRANQSVIYSNIQDLNLTIFCVNRHVIQHIHAILFTFVSNDLFGEKN